MKERLEVVVGASLFVMVLAMAMGTLDNVDDPKVGQSRYCKMVKAWNDSSHLPEEDRPGWPPYKGEGQCHE